jgi:hypothetical protein
MKPSRACPFTTAARHEGAAGLRRACRVALLALAFPALAQATPPPAVPGVAASKNGNDLVISWAAPAVPVDGYRVYKANDTACSSISLLYTGTAFSYTVAGAFQDPAPAMYAVAAYAGPDEGPRSYPIYKSSTSTRWTSRHRPPACGTGGSSRSRRSWRNRIDRSRSAPT